MKKKAKVLFILLVIPLLCGFCIHDWTEASCTEPSVCLRCGEVRGEALGHVWESDAGILICTRCGAFDDSEEKAAIAAIGRTTTPAYTVPDVPIEAPEVVPEAPNTPESDFERYGISADMAVNEVYPFSTGTRDMSGLATVGTLAVTETGILPEDAVHPHRDGYEWHYVIMQANFGDFNAKNNGVRVLALCEDYYNIRLCGTSQRTDDEGYTAYTIVHNNAEAECRYKRTAQWSDWYTDEAGQRTVLYSCMWEVQIPMGYDGTVVGLYSSRLDWPEGEYIDEVYSQDAFCLYRLR